jgi:hypothetical protein
MGALFVRTCNLATICNGDYLHKYRFVKTEFNHGFKLSSSKPCGGPAVEKEKKWFFKIALVADLVFCVSASHLKRLLVQATRSQMPLVHQSLQPALRYKNETYSPSR